MAKDLKIRLSVLVPPPVFYWGLVAGCLAILPAELSSENVTLNSYYPAPSGVYQKILTTQATWLGRDPGGYLDVGTQAAPGSTPWGAAAKLAVMDPAGGAGGRVGINTTAPADRLEVDEPGGGEGGIYINGAAPGVQLAGGAGSLSSSGGAIVLQSGGKILVQRGAGASALSVWGGAAGFSNPSPAHTADVGGDLVSRACKGVAPTGYAGILGSNFQKVTNCPANTYATWVSGVLSNCQSQFIGFTQPGGSDGAIEGAGEMICCPCPPGGCPNLPPPPGGICP